MYYISSKASRIRQREAQRARDNRAEIVRALSHGQITRRDLFKWGLLTGTGMIALKNGLSPLARSAFAAVPTGTPRSPLNNARPFFEEFDRLFVPTPIQLTKIGTGDTAVARFPVAMDELDARRTSYHNDFSYDNKGDPTFINPTTLRGPVEGRPPRYTRDPTSPDPWAHQRWSEFFPKVGYLMSWAQVADPNVDPTNAVRFHPDLPAQNPTSVWSYGQGAAFDKNGVNTTRGNLPPFLIQGRYGEPILTRIYNATPKDAGDNGGFGRNESQLHFHNAHNGAESDGATNAHHFPGTFYDYRWSTTLARLDKKDSKGNLLYPIGKDLRASGPDDKGGLVPVGGDWREIQGTMWAHDHRFFFTAENVYKGNLGMVTYYSGRDRGYERPLDDKVADGVNLRLPSGYLKKNADGTPAYWGNRDYDLNLILSDAAFDQDGQLFFDIFDTDGFLGDVPLVNFQYKPFMNVLPRKYRFRMLSAGMSRFLQMRFADESNNPVPFQFIANDGNLLPNPYGPFDSNGRPVDNLPQQGTGERYEVIVDFSKVSGKTVWLVNTLQQTDGRLPDKQVPLAQAMKGVSKDPAVGPMMQFNIVSSIKSVDDPNVTLYATDPDNSQYLKPDPTLQIPVVTNPVRTRLVEWGRGGGDSRQANGQCIPDCPETASFPWTLKVNGQESHSMNANRVSLVIPKPGDIEHWTYKNGGGGWDHPIHLHFEEGVTFLRNGITPDPFENLVRKDVWRLGPGGSVTFQIQFGEYGGPYVTHCHNTVHEDFALLARIQLLNAGTNGNAPQAIVTKTPHASPDGVVFDYPDPEVLPEGDPI
jgi:FtsP/CotA-like multicopper oxidase with cupredoxin domain